MSPDEILNHRKNKFLSVGRNKGFVTSKTNNLVSDKSIITELKNKINIKYSITFILLIVVFLIIWLSF